MPHFGRRAGKIGKIEREMKAHDTKMETDMIRENRFDSGYEAAVEVVRKVGLRETRHIN